MVKEVDSNGFWRIKNNPLSKEGVFPYLGRQIDKSLEPNKIYWVYRPMSEISNPETVESFNAAPLIDEHEMIGDGWTKYDDRPAGGVVYNTHAKDGKLYGDIRIYSEKLKDEIESGKKELSMGYECNYEAQHGVFDGKEYDFVQKNLRGNHIALVNRGRMGSDVRVYDHFTFDTLEGIGEFEMETMDKEWNEADHPRDENNQKFVSKNGGSSSVANLVDREAESSGELKELEHILKQNDKEYTSGGYRNIKHFDDKDEYVSEWNRLSKEQPSVYEDIDLKKIKTAVFKSDSGYTMLKYVDKDLSDEAKEIAKKRYSIDEKIPSQDGNPKESGVGCSLNQQGNDSMEKVDKRKGISEVEAMLYEAKKDPAKLTDELIKTILQKMENNSYEASEKTKADDEDLKKEEKESEVEDKSCKDSCGAKDEDDKKVKDESEVAKEKNEEEAPTEEKEEGKKEDKKAEDAMIAVQDALPEILKRLENIEALVKGHEESESNVMYGLDEAPVKSNKMDLGLKLYLGE